MSDDQQSRAPKRGPYLKKNRAVRIEGEIAYIPLTKGYEAIIDADDVKLLNDFNWSACLSKGTFYAVRTEYSSGAKRKVSLHHLIFKPLSGFVIDHIDGNGLNNSRTNLRYASSEQNAQNRRIGPLNTTGFKGVCYRKCRKKWVVSITKSGKRHHVGEYFNLESAVSASIASREDLHGKFGRIK